MATPPAPLIVVIALLGAVPIGAGERAPAGLWRAALETGGGALEFGLEIRSGPAGLQAWLLNGSERTTVPEVRWSAPELRLEFEHFTSVVRATLSGDGTTLEGDWTRQLPVLPELRATFRAERASVAREPAGPEAASGAERLAGRWRAHFTDRDGPAVGILRAAADGTLEGTFLTSDGDLGRMVGSFEAGRLRLARFDGARPLLLTARLSDDGALEGDFWLVSHHSTWFAQRDPEAAIRDPYEQVDWSPETPLDLDERVFHDLAGERRSISDVVRPGAPLVIEVLGTWCPTCHEASRHLAELQRRYGARGVGFVGLAFEFAGDLDSALRGVRDYAERNGLAYPVLLATPDGSRFPSEVLDGVDGIFAFPTLLFVRGDGRPVAVYSGYSGRATGEDHDRLRREFEALIERLLSGA